MDALVAATGRQSAFANPRLRFLYRVGTRVFLLLGPLALLQLVLYPVLSGDPPQNWARYWLYLFFGVAVPGTLLLMRTVRWRADWFTCVCLGWATGHGLELVSLLVARHLGRPILFALWIPAAYLIALSRPLAMHDLMVPLARPGRVIAALAIAFVVASGGFLIYHFAEISERPNRISDEWFHIDNVHEFRDHGTIQNPRLSGEPMTYHMFSYAPAAAASLVTGDLGIDLLERYAGLSGILLVTCLLFNVGRTISGGSALVGLATALLLHLPIDVIGLLSRRISFGTLNLSISIYGSVSTLGGYLFCVAILLPVYWWYRGGHWRDGWVIPLFAFGAVGAKGVLGPLLLCATLGVLGWRLIVRRRLDRRALALLGLIAVATIPVTATLAFGEDSNAQLTKWRYAEYAPSTEYYKRLIALHWPDLLVRSFWIFGFTLLFLVGATVGTWACRKRPDLAEYLVFVWSLFLASLVPSLSFAILGYSELFFLNYGLVALATIAGFGLVSLGRYLVRRPLLLAGCVAAAAVLFLGAQAAFPAPVTRATLVQSLSLNRFAWPPVPRHESDVALREARAACVKPCTQIFLTSDIRDGLAWARRSMPLDSVFAVNVYNASAYGGYSERRAYYATAGYTLESNLATQENNFDAVIRHVAWRRTILDGWRAGDPETVGRMERSGISYLFIDRLNGDPVPDLAGLPPPIYDSRDFAIYKMP